MFDPSSGYPDGHVYLSSTSSAGGKGGGSDTYTAWGGVTWDCTGVVVTASKLSSFTPSGSLTWESVMSAISN